MIQDEKSAYMRWVAIGREQALKVGASRLFGAALIVTCTGLALLRLYAIPRIYSDSWAPMLLAAEFLSEAGRGADIYEAVFFQRGVKFQYPPVSLLYLSLAAFSWVSKATFLNFLNWLFLLLNAGLLGRLANVLFSEILSPRYRWRLSAAVFLCALVYAPIAVGYRIGQIQILINLLFTGACLALVQNRNALAGTLVGLTTCFKPQFVVLALFGLARTRFAFFVALGAIVALLGAGSLVIYGWETHVSYVKVLRFLSERGEAFYWNNSVNGIMNRYLDLASPIEGQVVSGVHQSLLPPYNRVVHLTTLAAALIFLVLPIALYSMAREPTTQLLFLSVLAVCSVLASPVAWIHHYGILLPIYLIALYSIAGSWRRLPVRMAALVASFLITSVQYPFIASAKGFFTLVHAPTFFGTCVLLGVLIAELFRRNREAARQVG